MYSIPPNKETVQQWKKLFLARICPDLDVQTAIETGLIPPLTMRNYAIIYELDSLIVDQGFTKDFACDLLLSQELFFYNGKLLSKSTLNKVYTHNKYDFTDAFNKCKKKEGEEEEENVEEVSAT